MTEMRLALPWPNKDSSPNARVHWARKAQVTKAARALAYLTTIEATRNRRPGWERATLAWQFCPPSRRRHDIDNLIAQHKAAQDGIADALGIDDSKFTTTYSIGEPVKGGAVHVTIGSDA